MPERSSKKKVSRDMNVVASYIVEEATGEDIPTNIEQEGQVREKNHNAVALGRLGGKKGGKARAASLTSVRRVEIARKAAQARWSKQP